MVPVVLVQSYLQRNTAFPNQSRCRIKDHCVGRLLAWRYRLDRCRVEDFRWTPYRSDELHFLSPEWIRSGPEIRTWRLVVLIVFFNLVYMHHVDQEGERTSGGPHIAPPEHLDRCGWACRSKFLSQDKLLEDPRVQALPVYIRPTPSQSPPDIPLPPDAPARRHCRGGIVGGTGGVVRWTRKNRGEASTSQAGPSTS
ncbi:hypothetical protein PIB30_040082 [Stylosanthes scabra]|uniref:Uncharacterized protein n=1 Tax=Stylosanthes scabra TaxID=79078 RepID=A0ABU6YCW5_9FABA|nr:hypothetical protein [Stylosanthes scabra]